MSNIPAIPHGISMAPRALARRTQRLIAVIIDSIGMGVVPFVIMFPSTMVPETSEFFGFLAFVAFIAIVVYQVMLLWKQGQTIGKKAMHIRIVMFETGENGGFVPNVLLRTVVNTLLGFIPFYSPIDIVFIFREDKRCLHDLIAGTTVVQT